MLDENTRGHEVVERGARRLQWDVELGRDDRRGEHDVARQQLLFHRPMASGAPRLGESGARRNQRCDAYRQTLLRPTASRWQTCMRFKCSFGNIVEIDDSN